MSRGETGGPLRRKWLKPMIKIKRDLDAPGGLLASVSNRTAEYLHRRGGVISGAFGFKCWKFGLF